MASCKHWRTGYCPYCAGESSAKGRKRLKAMSCGCSPYRRCPHLMVLCPRGHEYDANYYGNYCPRCKVNHLVVTNDWRSRHGLEQQTRRQW